MAKAEAKRLAKRLVRIEKRLIQLLEENHMATWDEVKEAVRRKDTVDESFMAFVGSMKEKLKELKDKPSGPTAEDMAEVIAILDEQGKQFSDAMVENTPAPVEETPVEEVPVEETPTEELPAEEPTPASEVPTDIAE